MAVSESKDQELSFSIFSKKACHSCKYCVATKPLKLAQRIDNSKLAWVLPKL